MKIMSLSLKFFVKNLARMRGSGLTAFVKASEKSKRDGIRSRRRDPLSRMSSVTDSAVKGCAPPPPGVIAHLGRWDGPLGRVGWTVVGVEKDG